eukprot:CAMPEP_0172369230 /NCGR_PEP_ID=MMETSP1060-20121228/31680_1 /TAXON_ID=37318 /ORGANISM="Pseudo-nitzschia pungens, Strain cf. cingulata" /LENGTH=51 /DNA_ID=CAMNT_0013094081 /DNA_START=202 /DNA_END=355 /DNA_ORIENTATION=-
MPRRSSRAGSDTGGKGAAEEKAGDGGPSLGPDPGAGAENKRSSSNSSNNNN